MNRLAVISGGTKGIGREIVDVFASQHFDIAVCARNSSDLDLLKKNVEFAYNVKLYCLPADMSHKEDVDNFSNMLVQLNRSIDVLVNNVGHYIPGTISEAAPNALENMMATNLYSAYWLTRPLINVMKKERRGHIFSICSVASLDAYPNSGIYTVSKYALLGLTKSLRQELIPWNIRVTAVIPGATYTASWHGTDLPEQRFMKPSDLAKAIYAAYNLSNQSVVEELVLRPQEGDL